MSIIAEERIKRGDGLAWQPDKEHELAAVFDWVTLMKNQYPELGLLRKVKVCDFKGKN